MARGIGGYAKKDVWLSREGWVVTSRKMGRYTYFERAGWLRPKGIGATPRCVAKSRGMGGYVEKDGWLSREGWVASREESVAALGQRDGWLCKEGWVAKSRGMGGYN